MRAKSVSNRFHTTLSESESQNNFKSCYFRVQFVPTVLINHSTRTHSDIFGRHEARVRKASLKVNLILTVRICVPRQLQM